MKSHHQVNAIVEGILDYLGQKKSLDLLPEVAKQLARLSFVRVDPNLAVISAPISLNPDQQKEIKSSLSKYLNRPIRLKTKLDKSIVAGLKIEVAGQVIDATMNRKLDDLKLKVIYG